MIETSFITKEKEYAVTVKKNVIINSFNYITNGTQIKENTVLEPFNIIKNTRIGKNCVITSSKIENSLVLNEVKIGPNAHLRPDSIIENNAKIGNFVEVKKSTVGEGSKVSHMSYIGDGTIGKNCNIGCGTIFCNYDGKNKHQTVLEDNVFVGSNSNLVAPIHLHKNSFVAAGSTLTFDVEENALAIARERQINKPNYKRKE